MTELGVYIDEEILLRLQANDLIPCKSVCKSWNSLISSNRFIKSHLDRQHSKGSGETRIIGRKNRYGRCQVIGSSNGLVCVSYYYRHIKFFVINPSTREVKELINLPDYALSVHVSGFGYDSSIDDYKVVIGSQELPNKFPKYFVLELKKNIWRFIFEDSDYDYDYLYGNGILCNGAIHWLHQDYFRKPPFEIIVSFDLSKEVFKKTSLPKLDAKWNLGTMKDRLCLFRFPDTDLKANDDKIEIWVMRSDQVSWERKLLPPGYDANKTTMDYVTHKNFLSGHVHIWLLEEGSSAPVLLRSIDPSYNQHIDPDYHEHIPLYTYSECINNYDDHVFVKSLVSPHGMRIKSKRHSHVSSDSDGDGRGVDRKRRERHRESHVFHSSDKVRAKSRRQSQASSDSDGDRWRVDRKRRERDRESLMFHSSDKGKAKSKRQHQVSSDSDGDEKGGRGFRARGR